MESDVTKNRLSSSMSNNPASSGLHTSGQGSGLDNHNWKHIDSEDTQDTINQVQEMVSHSHVMNMFCCSKYVIIFNVP